MMKKNFFHTVIWVSFEIKASAASFLGCTGGCSTSAVMLTRGKKLSYH